MTGRISSMGAGAAGLVAILSLVLAGCSDAGSTMPAGQDFTPNQVSRFVIAKGDLPSEYKKVDSANTTEPCDSGWLANKGGFVETANEAAIKQQLLALGPLRCHRSLFERTVRDEVTDDTGVTGFGVFAVLFPDAGAASAALPLLRASNSDPLLRESYGEDGGMLSPAEDLLDPALGDELAMGIRRASPVSGGPDEYTYIWRVRNVAVVLEGAADLAEADVLRVAENISARAVR